VRTGLFIFILALLVSCAKKPDEKTEDAIDVALTMLSENKCEKAITLLEENGRDTSNAVYLQVLASAYACRADYDTISFISDDIPTITAAGSSIMTAFAGLTLSQETTTDSTAYLGLQTAINLLQDSDGASSPSQANRLSYYGPRKAGDMGLSILLYSIVELGKFLNHYGNANSSGAKGLGAGTNTCFMNYTYATAQAAVAAYPVANNCNSNTSGHPDMTNAKACEGLVLFTNILDVLNNLDLSGSSDFSSLSSVTTAANTLKDAAIAADSNLSSLLNTTSQSACETLLASSTQVNYMQLIYALLFEAGLN